ncbi:hypothetical protein [Telluria beijingensis]|uniref:hypothetical protein n=1 Tax=Telluria beijingensis TaxID=3068633 RepID=UPI0027952492|nr:hypothetical protein [Massilia sp. REN29]
MHIKDHFKNIQPKLKYKNRIAWAGNIPFFSSVDREYKALFKYTKMKYAEQMLNLGRFRIGTLYEYQGMEIAEIGDRYEGFRGYQTNPEVPIAPQLDTLIKHVRYLEPVRNYPAFNKHPIGMPVQIDVIAPDMYLLCFTRNFDREAMTRFGYDACIEISNPTGFLHSLNEAMLPYAYSGCINTCHYSDRIIQINDNSVPPPQSIKGREFEHQQEVRLVWDPLPLKNLWRKDNLPVLKDYEFGPSSKPALNAPIILECPDAAKYCKLIF